MLFVYTVYSYLNGDCVYCWWHLHFEIPGLHFQVKALSISSGDCCKIVVWQYDGLVPRLFWICLSPDRSPNCGESYILDLSFSVKGSRRWLCEEFWFQHCIFLMKIHYKYFASVNVINCICLWTCQIFN